MNGEHKILFTKENLEDIDQQLFLETLITLVFVPRKFPISIMNRDLMDFVIYRPLS